MCLLVVLGCGLGQVVGPNFSFVTGGVGSVSWLVGLGWTGSKKTIHGQLCFELIAWDWDSLNGQTDISFV